MEPLVFQIQTQADDSKIRQYDKSLGGLDVSSRKASGALKGFVQDIAQARDGADLASATLGAFSRILGSSLAATGVIIAVKTVVDGFNKIDQAVKESEKAVADAFAGMQKAGETLTFAEAVGQAKTFESAAYKIREEIKKINDSPMLNIIDGLMQSTDKMRELAKQSEDQAIAIRKVGAESELAYLTRIKDLDAEGKAIAANERALQKELEGINAIKESSTALAVTQKYAMQADEIRAKFADERAKSEEEIAKQRQKDLDEQIKKEKELGEAQQKRFNELYDLEIKAQEASQKRIDAELKAEQEKASKRASLEQDVSKAKDELKRQVGESAIDIARASTGGSGSRNGRETSFEQGLRASAQRNFQAGRREAANAELQRVADQINRERAATGETRKVGPQSSEVQSRLKQQSDTASRMAGKESIGTQELTKNLSNSTQALDDFNNSQSQATDATESFSSNLSDMGTGFENAIDNANNFADSMMENTGNMVDNFLKAGSESNNLGDNFGETGKAVEDFGNKIEKAAQAPSKREGGGGGGTEGRGSLASIEKLLQKNFDELKAYAHAT